MGFWVSSWCLEADVTCFSVPSLASKGRGWCDGEGACPVHWCLDACFTSSWTVGSTAAWSKSRARCRLLRQCWQCCWVERTLSRSQEVVVKARLGCVWTEGRNQKCSERGTLLEREWLARSFLKLWSWDSFPFLIIEVPTELLFMYVHWYWWY